MKFLLAALLLTFFQTDNQDVSIVLDKTEYQQGELLKFQLKCASEEDLEITVFTENQLLMYYNSTLREGETPFEIDTKEAMPGKYFILVTGKEIHVEKEFQVINP